MQHTTQHRQLYNLYILVFIVDFVVNLHAYTFVLFLFYFVNFVFFFIETISFSLLLQFRIRFNVFSSVLKLKREEDEEEDEIALTLACTTGPL